MRFGDAERKYLSIFPHRKNTASLTTASHQPIFTPIEFYPKLDACSLLPLELLVTPLDGRTIHAAQTGEQAAADGCEEQAD